MKLEKKKLLAARTLKIGANRIRFNSKRLDEIKEAITKQDIKDLVNSGAILIKEKKGRRKIENRMTRRREGSRRKNIKKSKQEYVKLTRKLRTHLFSLKKKGIISRGNYFEIRKEIRTGAFANLAHLKEKISNLKS